MKRNARDVSGFIHKPDFNCNAALIYGPASSLIAEYRKILIHKILETQDDPFRKVDLSRDTLRKNPEILYDSLREQSFIAGRRVILIEQAGDFLTKSVKSALENLPETGNSGSFLLITADSLKPSSSLRKLFETGQKSIALPCYENTFTSSDLPKLLSRAGISQYNTMAEKYLADIITGMDRGSAQQLVDKLGLYMLEAAEPLTTEVISLCAPPSMDAETDMVTQAIIEGQAQSIPPLFSRLQAQGIAPAGILSITTWVFRRLHQVASMVESGVNAENAVSRLRPPPPFQVKSRMIRQAQAFSTEQLEAALEIFAQTEIHLRSGKSIPEAAVIERSFIRVAALLRHS